MTSVDDDARRYLSAFRLRKVLLPVAIGLGITALLVWQYSDWTALNAVRWTWSTTFWMLLAALSVVLRDYAYMVRIRHLTEQHLTWYRTFVVIML